MTRSDEAINDRAVEKHDARHEEICRVCDGDGFDWTGDECDACDGEGVTW